MNRSRSGVERSCQSYRPYTLTTASTEVSASAGSSACHCGSLAVSPAKVAKWPPAEHPATATKLGSPPNSDDVGPCPRNRSFDISHLARPAVSRAGPVLNRQAHPPSPRQVGHQRVALQLPTAEHPCSAGYEDEHGRRLRRARRCFARRRAAGLGGRHSAPTSGTRIAAARPPSTAGARSRCEGHGWASCSGATMPSNASVSTLGVSASCGVSLLALPGQPGLRHAGDDARYIASGRPRRELQSHRASPDGARRRHRRRRGAERDHIVTWLGPRHPSERRNARCGLPARLPIRASP